jgi:RPA family protein
MRTGEVHELVDRAATLESCSRDRVAVEAEVAVLGRLRAWLDSRDVAAARLMAEVSSFPEKSLADASRTGMKTAEQMLRRAATVDLVPEFGSSLHASTTNASITTVGC